jgi:hypothetical protein
MPNAAVLERIACALEHLVDVKRFEVCLLPFLPPFAAPLTVCRTVCLPLWQTRKNGKMRRKKAVLLLGSTMVGSAAGGVALVFSNQFFSLPA